MENVNKSSITRSADRCIYVKDKIIRITIAWKLIDIANKRKCLICTGKIFIDNINKYNFMFTSMH